MILTLKASFNYVLFCRDTQGNCHLLRVEITLKGATYHIAFSNSEQLPPPFRIDNFSEVNHSWQLLLPMHP